MLGSSPGPGIDHVPGVAHPSQRIGLEVREPSFSKEQGQSDGPGRGRLVRPPPPRRQPGTEGEFR